MCTLAHTPAVFLINNKENEIIMFDQGGVTVLAFHSRAMGSNPAQV